MEKIGALKIHPPPTPNRKEFPFVGCARIQGLRIDLENLAGSVREGKGPKGSTWKTKMRYHYGEIRKTKGTDNDKLDVYIGPNPQSKRVFIVHQNFPGNHPSRAGKYDEDKVMLGFNSPEEAKRAYIKQYSRKDFFRSLTEMPMAQFKKSIYKENKGEKVAVLLGLDKLSENYRTQTVYRPVKREVFADDYNPWEQVDLSQASPEERGRSFFVRGGAFSATPDPKEFDRLLKERELLWNAEPELRAKWTEFMGRYPGWYPHHEQPPQVEDEEMLNSYEKGAGCKTPGEKIRSKGKGRGLARGKGEGPVGVPIVHKLRAFSKTRKKDKRLDDAGCKTPGEKIRSKGKGRGLARGKGEGPVGVPIVHKLRAFAKTRKKDKRPDDATREQMKTGSLRNAYVLGVKTAMAEASTAMDALTKSKPMQQFGKITPPTLASGAPPATTAGAAETV